MLRFKISGMSCGHCAQTVTEAIRTVDRSAAVEIDLPAGEVTVTGAADAATVADAVTSAGYTVERRIA